jgi:hypothetical protein
MLDEDFETRVVAWLAGELVGAQAEAVQAELADRERARAAAPLIAAWKGDLSIARADTRRAWSELRARILQAQREPFSIGHSRLSLNDK